MKIEIKNVKGDVIFSHECEGNTVKKTVEEAVKMRISLRNADLSDANLRGANLRGANLRYADLRDADLRYADLRYADLRDADLRNANLRNANLRNANLRNADLSGADLRNADLIGANIDDVLYSYRTSFFSMQCPEEGSFVGWKLASGKIVKLLITEDSKRSSATSLKCRCSKAKVLDIQEVDGSPSNVNEVRSNYDESFIYRKGDVAEVDDFDEDRWNECSTGIHFFVSRDVAVIYYN